MAARFTDAQIIQMAQKAARRLNRRLNLFGTSNEMSISNAGEMTPDNGSLYDLILLQVECMILNREISDEFSSGGVGGGISIHDGEQSFDSKRSGNDRVSYLENKHGPCAELEAAILDYLYDNSDVRDIW
jgi:hypothetical protein